MALDLDRLISTRAHGLRLGAVFLTALLLWSFTHPLLSIDKHDARIYSVLALHHLNPVAFSRDPFFMFGSQDNYSLFSYIYAPLISHFGLTVAGGAVLFLGGVLWCTAAILLSHTLLRSAPGGGWIWIVVALAISVSSPNYSPSGSTFLVNEGFATARSWAFPLGLLSLAYTLKGKVSISAAFALAACLLHPLLGIWPAAVALLMPLRPFKQALLIAIAVVLLGGFMISEMGPFARFDPAWEHILRAYTHDVFVDAPSQLRWQGHFFQLSLLFSTAYLVGCSTSVGRWYRLVGAVALIGFLASMLASYFWPSQIVIQAQLWRSMWLAAALVPLALGHLLAIVIGILKLGAGKMPWLLLLILTCVFVWYEDTGVLGLVLLVIVVCLGKWCQARWGSEDSLKWIRRAHSNRWLPWFSGGMLLIALPLYWSELALLGGAISRPFPIQLSEVVGFAAIGGLGLGFSVIAWLLINYATNLIFLGILGSLFVCSILGWDQRSERDRKWEAVAAWGRHDVLANWIHPGDVVLWDGNAPLNAWYELRTAHYASSVQAIGMVFSREKTFELLRRVAHIRAAESQERAEVFDDQGYPFRFRVPTGRGIALLCSDGTLDWIVVSDKSVPAPGVPFIGMPDLGLIAYRCSSVREVVGRHVSGKV